MCSFAEQGAGDDGEFSEYSDDEAHKGQRKGHGARGVSRHIRRGVVVVALLLAAMYAEELGELLHTLRKPVVHAKKQAHVISAQLKTRAVGKQFRLERWAGPDSGVVEAAGGAVAAAEGAVAAAALTLSGNNAGGGGGGGGDGGGGDGGAGRKTIPAVRHGLAKV
jgi:hypothetical protein